MHASVKTGMIDSTVGLEMVGRRLFEKLQYVLNA